MYETVSGNATFAFIKPEAFDKKVVGEIYSMIENRDDLEIIDVQIIFADESRVRKHYKEHEGKDFYEKLISKIANKSIMIMRIYSHEVGTVQRFRELVGSTNPKEADENSIRGKFGFVDEEGSPYNMIHASDSEDSAIKEMALWFD